MMKSKIARQTAAVFKESQNCNAPKQKAAGTIAARHAQELMQKFAFRFALHNANAEELPDLNALLATNAG